MWKSLLARAKSRSQNPCNPAPSWKTGIAALALGTLGALPATAQLNYPITINTVGTPSAANPGFLVHSQTWKSLTDNIAYPSGVVDITSTFVVDPTLDDDNSSEQTLGFNFPLTGGLFDKIIVNTNGYLKLGTAGMTPPSATISTSPT